MSNDPNSKDRRPSFDLAGVVDALVQRNDELVAQGPRKRPGRQLLPSRESLVGAIEQVRAAMFPAHFGKVEPSGEGLRYYIGATLDGALQTLHEQTRRAFDYTCPLDPAECEACEEKALQTTRAFAAKLPEVRSLLARDIQAAYDGDPAATGPDETVVSYPGIEAVTFYRLAHVLHGLQVPLIPRIITEHAHAQTGIDIHPGAKIGGAFFIDHGTGVVIGATAEVGERVTLYQGVTLGAKNFPLDELGKPIKGLPRHPKIEDDVVIYAGATVLGRIVIGKGSSIGGNVWLTASVPPGSRISQASVRRDDFDGGVGI